MKKICVVGGGGYVGKSIVNLFKNHPDYLVHIKEKGLKAVGADEAEVDIICVPTPMDEKGMCDISIVKEVLLESTAPIFLIKSAIPPGTANLLKKETGKRIVVSPEYIGEGQYPLPFWQGLPHPTDMSKHDFQIFGGSKRNTQYMVDLFSPVLGPYCRFFQTDSNTAELTKYMENCFIATKIVFCHEFSRIAKVFQVDYRELRELWLLDGRVNRGSTAVFDENNLGYGGKCLPKDISGIYHAAKKAGFTSDFLRQVVATNKELKEGAE